MLEYCTWFTNAAGDKQGSRSLWSQSMDIFPNLLFCPYQYFTLREIEWLFCCIAEWRQPLKKESNPFEEAGKLRRNKKYLRSLWYLSCRKKAAVWWDLHSPCAYSLPCSMKAQLWLCLNWTFLVSAPLQNTCKPQGEKNSGFSFHLLLRKRVMFVTAVAVARTLNESSEKFWLPSFVVFLRENGRPADCAFPPNCEAEAECSRAG